MGLLLKFLGQGVCGIDYFFKKSELVNEEADYWLPDVFKMKLKVSLSMPFHYPFIIHLIENRANSSNQPLLYLIISYYFIYIFLWEVSVKILKIDNNILNIEESSHYLLNEKTFPIPKILLFKGAWTKIYINLLIQLQITKFSLFDYIEEI